MVAGQVARRATLRMTAVESIPQFHKVAPRQSGKPWRFPSASATARFSRIGTRGILKIFQKSDQN
jgi:hypothetical protein